jgi:hypothetical protein
MILTVAAKDVRVGDYRFNKYAWCDAAKWNRVHEVKQEDGHVALSMFAYEEWFHPEEGVAIQRHAWTDNPEL